VRGGQPALPGDDHEPPDAGADSGMVVKRGPWGLSRTRSTTRPVELNPGTDSRICTLSSNGRRSCPSLSGRRGRCRRAGGSPTGMEPSATPEDCLRRPGSPRRVVARCGVRPHPTPRSLGSPSSGAESGCSAVHVWIRGVCPA
jgi:hypothetical protein